MLLVESLLGSSSAESTFIEDVFSTWLYTGNGSAQTISNGIDLGTTINEATYITPGTYSWTAPTDVTSVCVVAVGGGGGDSYFINTSTVRGGAPTGTNGGTGGTYTGDGGGNGGNAGAPAPNDPTWWAGGGGGGAGGYSGNGGAGGNAASGSGAAHRFGGGGGGVGLFGAGLSGSGGTRLGASGSGGGGGGGGGANGTTTNGTPGTGGSSGNSGSSSSGGSYGGGGAGLTTSRGGAGLGWKNNISVTPGQSYTVVVGASAQGVNEGVSQGGAVRIIWGAGRSFPSTNTSPIRSSSGGLVWLKGRSGATDHALYDTARGATLDLASNTTSAQTGQLTGLTDFLTNGFSIGSLAKINTNNATYASWTFREQPKFFDIVTYTGDGTNGRSVPHSLGSVPGMIIVKRTNAAGAWCVYHRSAGGDLFLNTTAAQTGTLTNITFATSTTFDVGVSSGNDANANGGIYVAYLFAHNAGGFGATGADNVISCGSFTTDGSGNATVTLGYEPQWILYKNINTGGNWFTYDVMRGWNTSSDEPYLLPNTADTEGSQSTGQPTATGFTFFGNSSANFIYMAIRRGPMRTPTSGTSVFGLNARTGTGANATVTGGQTDDAVLIKNRGAAVASLFSSRLTGTGYLVTSSTAAEVAAGTAILQANPWDVMDGVKVGTTSTITNASANTFINYLFRRAPGFFDVVAYSGTGANQSVSHNLGVAPELLIAKSRNDPTAWTFAWGVYVSSMTTPSNQILALNASNPINFGGSVLTGAPSSTSFTLNTNSQYNGSGYNYIAYLFASCPGVSRVGTYTGTGTTQVIDCGFSNGARFVLIKRTDSTGDWYVWDTARGIVAANDPYLVLNSTAAEVTTTDWVDTAASGFELSNAGGNLVNTNGGSYIFLAIA